MWVTDDAWQDVFRFFIRPILKFSPNQQLSYLYSKFHHGKHLREHQNITFIF